MNVTSRQKDLTSQHKDLTRLQNHMTTGDRNMPPYCLEVTPLDIWSNSFLEIQNFRTSASASNYRAP